MAQQTKVKKGSKVEYTPYDDDNKLTGKTTGKIVSFNENGTVNLSFKPKKEASGVISDPEITRQFVPYDPEGGYNTWREIQATEPEKTGETGTTTTTTPKAPETTPEQA